MRTATQATALILSAALLAACGPKVMVPPRIDLANFPVGLVTFTMEDAEGELNLLATEYFARELFDAQNGIQVLELGEMSEVLEETGRERFDSRAARALGEEYDIGAVFVGNVMASPVRPRASISLRPRVEAVVSVELSVRMLSTETGATIWSNSARATETVGGLGLTGGEIIFSAEDPDEAYGHLIEHLISELTLDFWPTYR